MSTTLNVFLDGNLWTALGGIAAAGLAVLVSVAATTRRRLNMRWTALCAAGIAAGIAGTLVYAPHPNEVLVTRPATPLLLSPFEGAETKGTLAAGERARATQSHGAFAYVESEDGTAGWVNQSSVSRFVGIW